MKCCRGFAALICVVVLFGAAAQAADDPCSIKRLDWMLEDEQCGDLVFADVIEIMHTCPDVRMRSRAAAGLGRLRGPEVFSALYRVLERDRSPMVRGEAVNALASIIQRAKLLPGREIMEAFFLVFQFDRYSANRTKARAMLELFNASPQLLAERTYLSPTYRSLEPLPVRTSANEKSALAATLQPDDGFAIVDEAPGNDQTNCWFSIETSSGIRGWVRGLRDGREYIGTDAGVPRAFDSTVRSMAEIVNPAPTFAVELRTSSQGNTFRPGDEIVFFVKTTQDCFVTVVYFSAQSGGYILFPNRDQPDGFVRAGAELRIPAEGSSLKFKASAPGVEEIGVIATRVPMEIFAPAEIEPGAIGAIKTGRQETARGVDRLLRYFKADLWAVSHKTIQTLE